MPVSPTGVSLNQRFCHAARDGVVEDAVGGAGHRVHADEERRIAAFLEEARVARPLLLDDVLARGVEIFGDQRVERVALAGAVAVQTTISVAPAAFAPRTAALISPV